MKLLISIAFYFTADTTDRFKYLFKVVDNFIDEYKIDFTLNIDTNTDIVIPILNKKYEKYITDNKITITIHDESKMNHPYELTEKHRYLFLENIDNYDYFMYIEDDILVPYNSFTEYLVKFNELYYDFGCVPGFVRLEEREGIYFHTDSDKINFRKREHVFIIKGRKYFKPDNPYHGFWILPKDVLKEKIKETANNSNFIFEEGVFKIYDGMSRENMAAYTSFQLKLETLIELDENIKVHKNCYCYHLPNNYVKKITSICCGLAASVPINIMMLIVD